MKIVYLGSGEFGIDCLNALADSCHSLELIVTQPPHPAGRGRKIRHTPVALWASRSDCEVALVETDNINSPETIEKIKACQPDLIVVIAFGQKISAEVTKIPPKSAINVHASLLPKYRGAAPINWAIINGETETGISIITIAEKMDAGLVCAAAKTPIELNETAGRLHDRLAKLSAPLLLKTIGKIADGSVVYNEQDSSLVTKALKLKKSDGFLDFGEPANELKNKIHGFWPWPGASAAYISKQTGKCKRVIIAEAKVMKTPNPTGVATGILDDNLNIICGVDALGIVKIKPAGGHLLDFKDFANGRAIKPGDLFMKIEK